MLLAPVRNARLIVPLSGGGPAFLRRVLHLPTFRSSDIGAFGSPLRNLTVGVAFMPVIFVLATAADMAVGWSFGDAVYWIILTIHTVGYDAIRLVVTREGDLDVLMGS
jgi:hypothetical protein